MDKLTNLGHLEAASRAAKGLIGEVAETAAEAIEELAAEQRRSIPTKEVTRAQYDALSEEEKQAAVLYVLPDAQGGGSPGAGGDSFPPGGIIIWSGAADAVPEGWAVCDGENGTPDLRDRFVLGGGGSQAVSTMGGEETHKLTTSEMPAHGHAQSMYYSTSVVGDGSGKRTVSVVPIWGSYDHYRTDGGSGNFTESLLNKGPSSLSISDGTRYTSGLFAARTECMLSSTTEVNSPQSTSISRNSVSPLPTYNAGGGLPHNNMPPYYVLCYIMKL